MAFPRKVWKRLRTWKSGAPFCVRLATSGSLVDDACGEDEEEGLVFAHAEAADDDFLAFFDVDVGVEGKDLYLTLSGRPRHSHSRSQPVNSHRRALRVDVYRPNT